MIKKKINIPIYSGELVMIKAKGLTEVGKHYDMDGFEHFQAVVWRNEKKGYLKLYVALSDNSSAKVIAHEAVHLVNHVFTAMRVSLDAYNDEPQAYLTGWFVEQIEKFLKK